MGEVGNIWIKIGAKWDEVEKATSAIDKAMVKIGDKFQRIGKDLSIAGGAITAAMGLIVVKTANLGDQFYDLSQRTGIAVETLSSFKLAADKSGTSIGGFATGMKGLSRSMADAASGGKESKEAFDAVGVSATDDVGRLRPLDQVMLDVADRFAAMENGAEKNALALKLFGKSGMDLIPMLNLGRKGLEENIEQMKKFGIVTTEDARLGDAFNDAMTELQAATGGLTRVIGNALIPVMTSLATKAADIIAKVSAWAREHPLLTKVISGTVLAIGGLLTALGSMAYTIGTVLKHLPTLITGFKTIIAFASKAIIFTFTLAGVAIVTAAIAKMIRDFKDLKEAGQSTGEALKNIGLGFNPFKNMSREGLGKFLTDMEEAKNQTINIKGALILLADAFKAIKGAVETGAITPVVNLTAIFKELGLKTKKELTDELENAEKALEALKGSTQSAPGIVKALEEKIVSLKDALSGASGLINNLEKAEAALKALKNSGKATPADIFAATEAIRKLKEEINQTHPELLATSLGLITKTQAEQKLKTLVAAYVELAEKGLLTNASVQSFVDQIKVLEKELDLAKGHFDGLGGTAGSFATIAVQMFKSIQFEVFVKARDGIAGFKEGIDQASGSLSILSPFMLRVIQGVQNLGQVAADSGVKLKSQLATELKKLEENLRTFQKTQALTAPDTMKMVADVINLYKQLGLAVPKEWQKIYDAAKKASEGIVYVSETATGGMAQAYVDCANEMAKAFGEAFASIIRDGLTFANFFKSLMQGIINAVATLVGKQLTTIFIDFFKKLGAQAGGAFSGFSESANAAAFGIAAGFAAMWVGIGIGMIESKRQWDEYWDEIEEKARRAGKTILETIKLAQLLDDAIGDIADEVRRIAPGPGPVVFPEPEPKVSEWEKALNAVRSCIDGIYASSEEMNDAWSNLLDTAKKLGKEGSKELIELIKAFRAAGKECQALNEYMQSWLKTIPNAILVLVHSMDVLISTSKKVKESLLDLFKGSTDAQKKNTKEFKRSLDEIGRLAILTFHSMIASGMSFYEAIMAISDSIYALRAEYKKLGMEVPIEFRKLFRIVGLTKQHKELFEAIDATRQIMIALGNSAWLTADAWTTLTGQAVKQFHLLRHHGFSVQDSLRAMAPTLQAIVNYADAYGFELDKQTQSLVNQARRMGLIKEVQKDQVTLMNEWNVGVQKAYNVFLAIAKVLGADVSGAMGGINDKMGLLNLKGETFAATGSEAEQTWKTAMAEMAVGARKAYQVLLLIAKVLGADISEFMNEMKDGALAFVDAGIQAGKAWVGAAIAAKKAWGSVIFPTANVPNFRHFASGGIAYTPQLARVAEYEPEIIIPLREYESGNLPGAGAGAASNQSITLQNHLYIDGREMKVFITKTIRDWSKAELMQIHPRAVRAY